MVSPDILFGELFCEVQLSRIFTDTKTFVDAVPLLSPENILMLYRAEKEKPDFNLEQFVRQYFDIPESATSHFVSDTSMTTKAHIERLWDVLTCPADPLVEGSSRLPLPHPYVVPGGRFREIFYWDSYFTMLGLQRSGRNGLVRGMVDNFAYLIDTYGFIPNGNRTYFLTRSQPPFFSLMVELLAEIDGADVFSEYLPQLEKEYAYWMAGGSGDTAVAEHVVTLDTGGLLNRYWDPTPTPRPEAFRVESELRTEARFLGVDPDNMYRNLRAACESGWDFSSRWMTDGQSIPYTITIDILPVDLNTLLFSFERTLAKAYRQSGQEMPTAEFTRKAEARRQLIQALFWDDQAGFYKDVHGSTLTPLPALTLAGVFPLFFQIATFEQAQRVHDLLEQEFLQSGGWVTTLKQSGQQWDWPNGWAPLQWIVYQGLLNYGFTATARKARDRWLMLNDKVFQVTGKMMEKYNVVDDVLVAGGGKYPNQDGFGWTNGVYLALLHS
ncbi:trehalase [Arsenicibacter rosenii]|uniref:Trehalase n=1 Tax=Arsenicibacter rosenii TaxID=1750698 RepID=A0A1S2VP28_9BACT|nr:trehalase [Arsenicibacter rosenii]